MAALTHLTDATFDESVLGADKPVLVDFTAVWCPPCQALAPILEEVAGEHADTLTIVKLDVDDNPAVTRRYDVMSMPTLILFRDGKPEKRMVGARGKHHLLDELSEYL